VDVSDPPERPEREGVTDSIRSELERLLGPGARAFGGIERRVRPIWREVTEGEPRWPVSIALVVAIVLQFFLPNRLSVHPRWILASLEGALLVGLIIANPRRIEKHSPNLRIASLALIGAISLVNGWSAVRLIRGLIDKTEPAKAAELLRTGGSIWLTNVIVFALWYWEGDRGGPAARAAGRNPYPDFLFTGMTSPDLVRPHWEPTFVDYFFLSFTNATAFSPTDTLPLSAWAKLAMSGQSAISLVTAALVVARAVNVLG
jgi:hypothetical protein